jgi:hypothetical protein
MTMEFMDEQRAAVSATMPQLRKGPIESLAKPSVNPPTTTKLKQAMDSKRAKLDQHREKEEEKAREERERQERLKKVCRAANHIRSWVRR